MARDEFEVISLRDQSVDWNAMAAAGPDKIREYWETRKIALVRPFIKHGKEPTIYVLREIPNDLADDYVLGSEPDEKDARLYRRAFKASVLRVKNLLQADGVVLQEVEPARWPNGVLQDSECGRIASQLQRLEIGAVALQRGFFPPGIEPTFRLPPSLLGLLAHPTQRPVVQSQASPAKNSAPASSGNPESSTPATTVSELSGYGESGGLPMDATAPDPLAAAG